MSYSTRQRTHVDHIASATSRRLHRSAVTLSVIITWVAIWFVITTWVAVNFDHVGHDYVGYHHIGHECSLIEHVDLSYHCDTLVDGIVPTSLLSTHG